MSSPIIPVTRLLHCAKCNLTFTNKSNLNKHLKSAKHKRAGECIEYHCSQCDFTTHDKSKWRSHIATSKHRFPNLVDRRSFCPRLQNLYNTYKILRQCDRSIRKKQSSLSDSSVSSYMKDTIRSKLPRIIDTRDDYADKHKSQMANIAQDMRTVCLMLLQPNLSTYINNWREAREEREARED